MIIKRPAIHVNINARAESYLCIATYLPLARWRDVPRFIALSSKVEGQLKALEGLAAYSVAFDPLSRRFWIYSVWADRTALGEFMRGEPHATAIRRMADWAANGAAFAEWESPEPRLDWQDPLQRLKQPTRYYSRPA